MCASCSSEPADVSSSRLDQIYRTAFVTGASAGLGSAFAEMLLQEGVRVWGTSRDASRLDGMRARHADFSAVTLRLDQAEASVAAFDAAAADAGGAFDLVILNAGFGVFGGFATAAFSDWQQQVEALLISTARLSHAALQGFQSPVCGTLVHVTSLAVEFPLPYMSGYNVAKAGLAALSESLIVETQGTGATVIDFRPGDYRTSFNQAMHAETSASQPEGRAARVWRRLDRNLEAGPAPERAAADLRRALRRRRSGIVRSGSFFQAGLAPRLARIAPERLLRVLMARYYGAS